MDTQVKTTSNELILLVIHHDVEFVRQLEYIADLEVTCSVSTATPTDTLVTLRQLQPQSGDCSRRQQRDLDHF